MLVKPGPKNSWWPLLLLENEDVCLTCPILFARTLSFGIFVKPKEEEIWQIQVVSMLRVLGNYLLKE